MTRKLANAVAINNKSGNTMINIEEYENTVTGALTYCGHVIETGKKGYWLAKNCIINHTGASR